MHSYHAAAMRNGDRLAALRKTALLDTQAEPAFDRFTRLAARLLDIPVALVTLVDEDRQFFKSCIGLAEPWASQRETPLSHSFCQHTVVHRAPFVVEDARIDPLVSNNLAIADLDVVAYAGVPLVTSDQYVLGAFCAIDSKPRVWSADDIALLQDLAASVMTEIELRNEIGERRRVEAERAQLLVREQAARRTAEAAQERLAFLSEVSKLLGASFEPDVSLASVARLAVTAQSDYCEVYLLGEHGQLRMVEAVAADPAKAAYLREVVQRYPLDPSWKKHPIAQVLRTGIPELVPEVSHEYLAATTQDNEHYQKVRELHPTSLIAVPIQLHGQVQGIIICTSTAATRRYNRDDLALFEEVGRRIAASINNARLFHETVAAMRARDEILSIVSHDLKNPLLAISLQVEVMKRRLLQISLPDAVELGEGLKHIDVVTRRMSCFIDDLLDIALLQENHPLALDCRLTDLVALVEQVVMEQRSRYPQHCIRIASAVPHLVGLFDVHRLERVVSNLLDNALKYSPPGSEIVVTLAGGGEPSDAAVLRVQDHGIGIPSADLPHIFDRFYRGSNAVNINSGTGLGLASVRQIVEQHGGTITITESDGGGTTFTVRLPLNHRQSHAVSPDKASAASNALQCAPSLAAGTVDEQ